MNAEFECWFESFLSGPGNKTFDVLREAFQKCWTTARVHTLAADADKLLLFGALRQVADLLESRMVVADITDEEKEALTLLRHILGKDYLAASQARQQGEVPDGLRYRAIDAGSADRPGC